MMNLIPTTKIVNIVPLFVRHPFRVFDLNSYLSLIIRIVISFKYNHCGIKYIEDETEYVVESRSGGVLKSTYSNWLKHRPNKVWEEGRMLKVDVTEINKRLGISYDVASLFNHLFYRVFGVWLGNKSDSQENCSEFLADILQLEKSYLQTPKSLYFLLNCKN